MNSFNLSLIAGLLVSGWCGAAEPAPTGLLCNLLREPEKSMITDPKPDFGWIMNSGRKDEIQSAWQILVSASEQDLAADKGAIWDSGKQVSAQSINVDYAGAALAPGTTYWWKVRTWDKEGQPSDYSAPQCFHTGEFNRQRAWPGESRWVWIPTSDGGKLRTFEDRPPVSYHPVKPREVIKNPDGSTFLDFERAAFSTLDLTLTWTPKDPSVSSCPINIDLAEQRAGNAADPKPGGGIIYQRIPLTLQPGTHAYAVPIPRFKAHFPQSRELPADMAEVLPFRYCQVIPGAETVVVTDARQGRLHLDFDEQASDFISSNAALNQVYGLCRYSTKINTFNGDYASSQRERMSYEADSYIHQMSHYAVDRNFATARHNIEDLIYHPTWPTEWIPHSVLSAYADYLHSGNKKMIAGYYDALKPKTLIALAGDDGFVSSRTGKLTPEFYESIHFTGKDFRDIVDWPEGERDGFVFREVNTVVNAFHYRALVLMGKIAEGLEKPADVTFYRDHADRLRKVFNERLFDAKRGVYVDGLGTDHVSVHGNLFPLAFGLVPPEHRRTVVDYLKSRGMACGVYPATYLLEGLYDAGEDQYPLALMTATTDRSWMNMIKAGSTVTTEAWDVKYKRNESWTHCWSSAPVQIIPRKLVGIEPLEPGFGKILIKPRPGDLEKARATLPTIRGPVSATFERGAGLKDFKLTFTIPANTRATIALPAGGKTTPALTVDGRTVNGRLQDGYIYLDAIGSGSHVVVR